MMLIDDLDASLRDIRYVEPTYNAPLAEGMNDKSSSILEASNP